MRAKALLVILVGALAWGCSKKSAEPATADAAAPSAAPATSAPQVEEGLADISKKVNSQQYDQAVGSLVALRGMPMSEKDQAAYNREVQRTFDALQQKAAQGDQHAQESYRMLGKFMTGR